MVRNSVELPNSPTDPFNSQASLPNSLIDLLKSSTDLLHYMAEQFVHDQVTNGNDYLTS